MHTLRDKSTLVRAASEHDVHNELHSLCILVLNCVVFRVTSEYAICNLHVILNFLSVLNN